jgi:hypothetical protein
MWALSFNNELIANEATAWSVDYFKQSLTQFHSNLATNQCAMEMATKPHYFIDFYGI